MFVGKDRSVSSVRCFVSSEKKTTAQKKLDRQERMGNLRDAFALSEKMETCGECASDRRYLYNGSDSRAGSKNIKKGRGAKCVLLTISIGQGI